MEIRALICLSEPSQRESSMNHCTVAHVISIWWPFEVIFQGSALSYGPQAVTGYPRGSLTHRQGWQGGAILIFILDLTFHMYAVYTQTHVCICTQTIASCICTHNHMHVYVQHTQAHACICTLTCVYMYTQPYVQYTQSHVCICTHSCMHVYAHTITCMYMYTQLHTCMYTHV